MPRMKHLLRKLHIGGETNRPAAVTTNPDPPPLPSSSDSKSSTMTTTIGSIANMDPSTDSTTMSSSQENSTSSGGGAGGTAVDTVGGATNTTDLDFNFLEEEFQVQLALAISVSDPSPKREDTESVQIKAAKRMSLGYSPSAAAEDSETLVEFLSLRYWNYNFVNYDEKIMDGFYDVFGITSNSILQGTMPLLVDLQALSIVDELDYEVLLVNRSIDHDLRQLEDKAYSISLECQVSGRNSLIQQIAHLVVERMGGAVGDADEMWKRWTFRSSELRSSLNNVVIPLGCLDVGLSRHRALLFKVLADRISLPCMLVKGSYYTGTDEGAVNLIKLNDGSEYIIDLMGAPGTLIPPEVPCSHLPGSGLDKGCSANIIETASDSSAFGLDNATDASNMMPDPGNDSNITCSMSEEAPCISFQTDEVNKNLTKKRETAKFEHEFGMLLPILPQLNDGPSGSAEKASSAQKIKVKDVSKYVISAAKNPEFAQKLHAVLLESGASPPADLFSDIDFQDIENQSIPDQVNLVEGRTIDDGAYPQLDQALPNNEQSLRPSKGLASNNVFYEKQKRYPEEPTKERNNLRTNKYYPVSVQSDSSTDGFVMVSGQFNETVHSDEASVMVSANSSRMATGAPFVNQLHESSLFSTVDSFKRDTHISNVADDTLFPQTVDKPMKRNETDRGFAANFMETSDNNLLIASSSHSERLNPLLGDAEEWEILWEDLQVAERIGIGSYGEVYHADWNGTEVAVKKFLVQDFTGDTLDQFKCEIEIMLRLRHPNVVLFMGAVTRPPNLSILTEFIPRGSLYRLLHRPNHHIDEKRRLRMALDVAKGMNYLHTSHPPIVHRDLKSANLLVDKNWVVKVCDFGLSRLKHHTFLSSKSTAGTPEWMAPEVLRNERSSEKCDIYSFGVILWELATSLVPWSGMNPMQVVGAVGFQNRRLDIPEDVDPVVAQIIRDCWQKDVSLRREQIIGSGIHGISSAIKERDVNSRTNSDPQIRPNFAHLIHRLRCVPRLYNQKTDSNTPVV